MASTGRLIAYTPPGTGSYCLRCLDERAEPLTVTTANSSVLQFDGTRVVAFDRRGDLIVLTEGGTRHILVIDVLAGRVATDIMCTKDIARIRFFPDGRRLAIGGYDGIALFDVGGRILESIGPVNERAILAMAASADHARVLATVRDTGAKPRLYRWDASPGSDFGAATEQELPADRFAEPILDCSPNGDQFAYMGEAIDPKSKVWHRTLDVSNGERWWPDHFNATGFGTDGRFWMVDNGEFQERFQGASTLSYGRTTRPAPRPV